MPDEDHGVLQGFLFRLIDAYLDDGGHGGRVGTEWRCIFGSRGHRGTFVPDLMYVSEGRRTRARPGERKYQRAAPDLIVEVLSPDHHAAAFARKLTFYLRHGVRLVWVIDPMQRQVTVYEPRRSPVLLAAGDYLRGGDVLPGFQVALDRLFARLDA